MDRNMVPLAFGRKCSRFAFTTTKSKFTWRRMPLSWRRVALSWRGMALTRWRIALTRRWIALTRWWIALARWWVALTLRRSCAVGGKKRQNTIISYLYIVLAFHFLKPKPCAGDG
tara:strand:- start:1709 stop:2053 length:345 start_codon:yes stop_codon:yes gene_type:complete